jgi:hypothetical protein
MKKVSLALGAVGVAPALGLIMPSTAAVASHTPAGTAQTVPHARSKVVRLDNVTNCIGKDSVKKSSPLGSFTVWFYHTTSTGCIGGVSGLYTSGRTGLSMRTRAYTISTDGAKTRVVNKYHNGHITGHGVSFYQGIHTVYGGVKQQVCAVVVSTGPNHAIYGGVAPVCVSFQT